MICVPASALTAQVDFTAVTRAANTLSFRVSGYTSLDVLRRAGFVGPNEGMLSVPQALAVNASSKSNPERDTACGRFIVCELTIIRSSDLGSSE